LILKINNLFLNNLVDMILRKLLLQILILLFCSNSIYSQKFPLQLFWQGKTELALNSAEAILQNKNNYSTKELISCYDFLAEYNLDQGHYEANLKFLNLLFKIKHQSSFDSALFYARTANYYHCYISPDSSNFFGVKAQRAFANFKSKSCDSNSIARYYGYLGNAFRNTASRNIIFLDSALLYSKENFIKAINHRRYATFLIDEMTGYANRKGNKEKYIHNTICCIAHLKQAEQFANQIFPNQKSDLHSRIFDLWALAERIKGNIKLSHDLTQKARLSLIDHQKVFNLFEYAASLNADASNKISQYRDKKRDVQLLLDAIKSLETSIPFWEGFLKEDLKFSRKFFDDRYSLNPYAKLSTAYCELYKNTKDIKYLYIIQGLSCITKDGAINSDKSKIRNIEFNRNIVIKLQQLSTKKDYAIINYIAAQNPNNLLAIVSMPDTTFLIPCADVDFLKYYNYNSSFVDVFRSPTKNIPKKLLFDAYNICFKKIDSLLQKNGIKNINIITHGLLNGLNFELLLTDTLSKNVFAESSLIKKYKIMYHSSASILYNYEGDTTLYSKICMLEPDYKKTSYPEIIFGKDFTKKIEMDFDIELNQKNENNLFFRNNQLIQFIGHIKSHEFSNEQFLIMSDSVYIKSSDFLQYDLTGSSYLLNGCASNTGKHEMNNRVNNLPNYLMNQNATSVISTMWPIDDKDNAEFLEKFYEFMANGIASSDALRRTKLYFAKNNYPPSMWGAYIYYGNDFYLSKKETSYLYLYISIGMILVIALFFIFLKKLKLRNNTL
jgi:hypothetical protein